MTLASWWFKNPEEALTVGGIPLGLAESENVMPQSHHAVEAISYLCMPYAPWCWNIYVTFARTKSPSHVGKYTSTMEHMGMLHVWNVYQHLP